MPKKITKKIYKPVKKSIENSKGKQEDFFMVKFKGLDKTEVKQLRTDMDEFLKDYLASEEELQTPQEFCVKY